METCFLFCFYDIVFRELLIGCLLFIIVFLLQFIKFFSFLVVLETKLRDEAHSKMTALRDRSEKDQTNYNLEVKELKRIIDHEQNLKEFMNVKAQERTEQKAIEAAKRKKRGT